MYCYIPAAPRLACVKPVASVHPEPGSNSPLLLYFYHLFLCCPQTGELTAGRSLRLTEGSRPLPSSCILSHYFNVLSFVFRASFFRVASAKLSRNFELCKSFCKFFFKISFGVSLSKPDRHCGTAVFRFASAKVDTFSLHSKYFTNFL